MSKNEIKSGGYAHGKSIGVLECIGILRVRAMELRAAGKFEAAGELMAVTNALLAIDIPADPIPAEI